MASRSNQMVSESQIVVSSAYHAMRTSGFLKLPSGRTLRDYVHYFSNRPGFQKEVHQQLFKEAKIESLPKKIEDLSPSSWTK